MLKAFQFHYYTNTQVIPRIRIYIYYQHCCVLCVHERKDKMEMEVQRARLRKAAFSMTRVAHVFAVAALILLLVWLLHFREGLDYHSDNPYRVFNVTKRFRIQEIVACTCLRFLDTKQDSFYWELMLCIFAPAGSPFDYGVWLHHHKRRRYPTPFSDMIIGGSFWALV